MQTIRIGVKLHTPTFMHQRRLRIGDFLILLSSLLIIGIMTYQVYVIGFTPAATVRIESCNGTFLYTLDENRNLPVEGPLGITEVIIEDRKVHVSSSPCRNQIAVAADKISKSGEWLINLPNGVFIVIEGGEPYGNGEIDDLAF